MLSSTPYQNNLGWWGRNNHPHFTITERQSLGDFGKVILPKDSETVTCGSQVTHWIEASSYLKDCVAETKDVRPCFTWTTFSVSSEPGPALGTEQVGNSYVLNGTKPHYPFTHRRLVRDPESAGRYPELCQRDSICPTLLSPYQKRINFWKDVYKKKILSLTAFFHGPKLVPVFYFIHSNIH